MSPIVGDTPVVALSKANRYGIGTGLVTFAICFAMGLVVASWPVAVVSSTAVGVITGVSLPYRYRRDTGRELE
jgi:hypothetical protein